MSNVSMRQMLEAGVHFGHQTRYWNPKMGPYIFGHRNKIHIVNLEKTLPLYNDAMNFVGKLAANGGKLMFVGTKRSARDVVRDGWKLFVSVPFSTPDGATRGLLWIEHDRGAIARATLLDPAWLSFQLVLFVLLSSQLVLTCVVLARRNRTIVFEKGYLKDHAVGALKLQHRLLGQIIRDHEEGDGAAREGPRVEIREPGKVIPFDRALRRSRDEEGGPS